VESWFCYRIVMTEIMSRYMHFILAGLFQHMQTGAVVPSQRFLIGKMLAPVPPDYQGRVVELGAGCGPLTLRLASKCPAARVLACEINPVLARDLRSHIKARGLGERVEVVSQPAQRLLSRLGRAEVEPVDFIISGIPLANLGGEKARALIGTISRTLTRGGMYIQFQHSLLDRKRIHSVFPKLRTVPAFLNFPPAFVYYAQH